MSLKLYSIVNRTLKKKKRTQKQAKKNPTNIYDVWVVDGVVDMSCFTFSSKVPLMFYAGIMGNETFSSASCLLKVYLYWHEEGGEVVSVT